MEAMIIKLYIYIIIVIVIIIIIIIIIYIIHAVIYSGMLKSCLKFGNHRK